MSAIGFVCLVFGSWIMAVWGTHQQEKHNTADAIGGFLVVVGLLLFVVVVFNLLWRYLP